MKVKTLFAFFAFLWMLLFAFCFKIDIFDDKKDSFINETDLNETYDEKMEFSFKKCNEHVLQTDNYSCSKEDIISYSNRFVNDINNELESYGTSIESELINKKNLYEKQLKEFKSNYKSKTEYDNLQLKFNGINEVLDNYKKYEDYFSNIKTSRAVVVNPDVYFDNILSNTALLAIYGSALAYFNAHDYKLAAELLEYMKSNNSINSSYKPTNFSSIRNSQGYKDILAMTETTGSYKFEKDGTKYGDDAFYSLHYVNYNKTKSNSGVIISDRYDYAYDRAYDDFKTDAVCNAMYTLQESGVLTPYYVILEFYECNSSEIKDSLKMNSTSRYLEKTSILGNGDVIQYDFSVSNTSNKTIQTYGPDDTYIKVYDEDNNILVSDDDSGFKYNALVSYLFEEGRKYKIEISLYSSSIAGNIRVGFASVDGREYSEITKITKTSGFFKDKYNDITIDSTQYHGNIFLLQNNEGKSFTIETKKNGSSYLDTYLYMIDPRRSNYYDGTGTDDDYHPLYIYNDDSAGNRQARLEVRYKEFFAKNTDFIILASAYNLSNIGKYSLSIIGLDTPKGIILW